MLRAFVHPRGASLLLSVLLFPGVPLAVGQEEGEPSRLWKDASGKFQVQARLIEQTDTTVRLHTDGGREVTVAIERLSSADHAYLKALRAPADDPFAGGRPLAGDRGDSVSESPAAPAGTFRALAESSSSGATMALPDTGQTLDLSGAGSDEPFVPDPRSEVASPPAAVVPISSVDAYDKLAQPVALDAAGSKFLVSIGRNKSGSPEETRGRIFAADLSATSSSPVWDHPRAVSVLDHDVATGRTLIVDDLDQFQRGGELVLVEGLATGNAKPLYRRTLPGAGRPGFAPQVQWARLLSGSHAAVIVNGDLLVWDLPAAQLVYKIEKVAATEPPALSANQVYMAVPQSHEVVIIETVTGTIRTKIPTGSSLKPGVAFDPAGRALAICFSNQYLVWDCVDQRAISQATTTDHLGSHPVSWLGTKRFLTALGAAIDLDLEMSVWKYSVSGSTERVILGDQLLTVTTSGQSTLVSAAIPHPGLEKSVGDLLRAGDAAMLVRPGSSVAVAVEALPGADEAEIKASLAAAAEKAGWKVSDRAPITLVAKIGRGEPQTLNFRSMGPGPRTESTATLTPFTAELEIRGGSDVLWTRSTVNRIPPILRLEEGETVQDAVKRYEKPDAQFFALLNLPPRIPKPEIAASVGMSVLRDGQWSDIQARPGGPPAGRPGLPGRRR